MLLYCYYHFCSCHPKICSNMSFNVDVIVCMSVSPRTLNTDKRSRTNIDLNSVGGAPLYTAHEYVYVYIYHVYIHHCNTAQVTGTPLLRNVGVKDSFWRH